MSRKLISLFICFLLLFEQSLPIGRQAASAQLAPSAVEGVAAELNIAGHLAGLHNSLASNTFRPIHLRYLSYNSLENNFRLFLDKGNQGQSQGLSPKGTVHDPQGTVPDQRLQDETKILLKYFLIGISLPNDTFWVNLRPDAEDNIIDDKLAQTDVGRIMLETDVQLKKDTASFTSPQTPEGRQYWDKLYKKAAELYSHDNITIPTLTRPWIVPGEIIIRETADSAYIYKATLKVMLESDYLNSNNPINSTNYSFKDERLKTLNEYSSQLIRELIIPKITKKVNSSKEYAALRQVYYSLIMAQWFKARFSQGLSPQAQGLSPKGTAQTQGLSPKGTVPELIDKQNLTNLTSKQPWSKTTYFQAYQKSFKDGEYKIHEPVYTPTGQVIRSYFSGGENLALLSANKILPIGDSIKTTNGSISVIRANSNSILNPAKEIELKVNANMEVEQSIAKSSPASSLNLKENLSKKRDIFLSAARDIYWQIDKGLVVNIENKGHNFSEVAATLFFFYCYYENNFARAYNRLIQYYPGLDDENKQGFQNIINYITAESKLGSQEEEFVTWLGKAEAIKIIEANKYNDDYWKQLIPGNKNPNSEINQKPYFDLGAGPNPIAYLKNLLKNRTYFFIDTSPFVKAFLNEAVSILALNPQKVKAVQANILSLEIFTTYLKESSVGTLRISNMGSYLNGQNIPAGWYDKIIECIAPSGQIIIEIRETPDAIKYNLPILSAFRKKLADNEEWIEEFGHYEADGTFKNNERGSEIAQIKTAFVFTRHLPQNFVLSIKEQPESKSTKTPPIFTYEHDYAALSYPEMDPKVYGDKNGIAMHRNRERFIFSKDSRLEIISENGKARTMNKEEIKYFQGEIEARLKQYTDEQDLKEMYDKMTGIWGGSTRSSPVALSTIVNFIHRHIQRTIYDTPLSPISPANVLPRNVYDNEFSLDRLFVIRGGGDSFAFRHQAPDLWSSEYQNQYTQNATAFWNELTKEIQGLHNEQIQRVLTEFYTGIRKVTAELVGKISAKETPWQTEQHVQLLELLDETTARLRLLVSESELLKWRKQQELLLNSFFEWWGHGLIVINGVPYSPLAGGQMYDDLHFVQQPPDLLSPELRQRAARLANRFPDYYDYQQKHKPTPATLQPTPEAVFKEAAQFLQLSPEDHLLDLGAGWGAFLQYVKQHGYTGQMSGFDQSFSMRLEAEKQGLPVKYWDVLAPALPQIKFTKVVAIDLLQDIKLPRVPEVVQRIVRSLEPGGRMYLSIYVEYEPGEFTIDKITEQTLHEVAQEFGLTIERVLHDNGKRIVFKIVKSPISNTSAPASSPVKTDLEMLSDSYEGLPIPVSNELAGQYISKNIKIAFQGLNYLIHEGSEYVYKKNGIYFIRVKGLWENTRQFAHIGFGRHYGITVVYIDQEISENSEYSSIVEEHELAEIKEWGKAIAGNNDLNLKGVVAYKRDLRDWMRTHLQEAIYWTNEFHRRANNALPAGSSDIDALAKRLGKPLGFYDPERSVINEDIIFGERASGQEKKRLEDLKEKLDVEFGIWQEDRTGKMYIRNRSEFTTLFKQACSIDVAVDPVDLEDADIDIDEEIFARQLLQNNIFFEEFKEQFGIAVNTDNVRKKQGTVSFRIRAPLETEDNIVNINMDKLKGSWIENLEELSKRSDRLAQWDFLNRFPGRKGIFVWRGVSKNGDDYLNRLGKIQMSDAHFGYNPGYVFGFTKDTMLLAYIPVSSMRFASWQTTKEKRSNEAEVLVDGEVELEDVFFLNNPGVYQRYARSVALYEAALMLPGNPLYNIGDREYLPTPSQAATPQSAGLQADAENSDISSSPIIQADFKLLAAWFSDKIARHSGFKQWLKTIKKLYEMSLEEEEWYRKALSASFAKKLRYELVVFKNRFLTLSKAKDYGRMNALVRDFEHRARKSFYEASLSKDIILIVLNGIGIELNKLTEPLGYIIDFKYSDFEKGASEKGMDSPDWQSLVLLEIQEARDVEISGDKVTGYFLASLTPGTSLFYAGSSLLQEPYVKIHRDALVFREEKRLEAEKANRSVLTVDVELNRMIGLEVDADKFEEEFNRFDKLYNAIRSRAVAAKTIEERIQQAELYILLHEAIHKLNEQKLMRLANVKDYYLIDKIQEDLGLPEEEMAYFKSAQEIVNISRDYSNVWSLVAVLLLLYYTGGVEHSEEALAYLSNKWGADKVLTWLEDKVANASDKEMYGYIVKAVKDVEKVWDNLSSRTQAYKKYSSPVSSNGKSQIVKKEMGGIDFRSLPIVTQAITNLSTSLRDSPLPSTSLGTSRRQSLSNVNLNAEWRAISRMCNSGITPSPERIKEYVQASCIKDTIMQDRNKVIMGISDILRQEEENCCSTEPLLKDILVVLETTNSQAQLKKVFLGT